MRRHSAVVLVVLLAGSAFGSGMLIPKDPSVPPLAIKHQRVDITIKDGVATARIEQVFKNSVDRDLEAVYVFPLPANASIGDFAMTINGKRMSGELVEKDKARKIYEDIVRRMKDPGLLEYLGGNLFKISIYPVPRNGEQRVELEYSQTLAFDSGLYKYVYPLKTGEKASQTLEDFTVSVRLNSTVAIKNIYSPSHEVGITRKSEHEAIIGFEQEQAVLEKDFVLYYGVSKKNFGLNLLTHAREDQDGFFMMMLAPSVEPYDGKIQNKDVTFVFDTSGSMAGKKIEQARSALEYCINTLNEGDRFNVLRFSTEVESLGEAMMEVNKETQEKALGFVEKIVARGGTAIDEALRVALSMDYDAARPSLIVFLTDGKPTIGESDTDAIVKSVAAGNKQGLRIFVFGVGEKVNTHLLDKVSGGNGGLSQYVKPEEDIEVKVSSLADKMSHPVLARVKVSVDKLKVSRMHPRELPDLFRGDQITVFGRYAADGHVAIRLEGEVDGKPQEFVYEGDFPRVNADNSFIPRLWATRRVGYLLDEIRLHGEDGELKEEVVRLSREYGIMTPYTSYLVLADDEAYTQHGIARDRQAPREADAGELFARKAASRRSSGYTANRSVDRAGERVTASIPGRAEERHTDLDSVVPVFEAGSADALAAAPAASARPQPKLKVIGGRRSDIDAYLALESGGKSIELSEAIESYKKRQTAVDDVRTVRHVGRKVFYFINGQWVDSAYKKEMSTRTVEFASDAYFKLLSDSPELKPFLTLGDKVLVVLDDGTALRVGD